ncbi:MBL fold metallo-hydrolase [Lacimicrobium alkaliphilum]|uniref:Metallo-beta-lactamase domain-containing protein n=1 Tax=Lacimicrobium alkaliphilum TaxID=1526571 RepID=A0ABQ1QVL0_9ALTE|nr:MBL fold metallo-hydrolase [Lacimicrobium alkaliphilum]GGD48420.1 hypothetical protein GCM10011357_00410 [Lacimicrobium alkaliphilum]
MFRNFVALTLISWPCLCFAIDIQQISDSVWVAVQPDTERFDDSNSLIMRGDNGVLVVDSQQSAEDVAAIISFIDNKIGLPVAVLVNTHWHTDHIQGNAHYKTAYGDKLTIIGHTSHLEDIPQRAQKTLQEQIIYLQAQLPIAEERLEQGIKMDGSPLSEAEATQQAQLIGQARIWLKNNKNTNFVLPDKVISKPLNLTKYGFDASVIPMSGHTRADLVVYLPQQKILACGDLLDAVPYLGHGNTRQWLATLKDMQDISPEFWLPGHGKPVDDHTLLNAMQFYFDELLAQINSFQEADLETLKQQVDVSASRARLTGDDPHKQRFFDHSLDEAITQTYESERQHRAQ